MRSKSVTCNTADVIVVMGTKVLPGGKACTVLKARMLHAIELYHKRCAPNLLLTGGIGRHPPSEAAVMKEMALQHEVPDENLILEEQACSTFENAKFCTEIISREAWQNILVVTDLVHMNRSLFIFRQFGIVATGSAPATSELDLSKSALACYMIREYAAWQWYQSRSTLHVRLMDRGP